MKYLGYDPGGTTRGGNGVASLTVGPDGHLQAESECLQSPTDAVKWLEVRRDGAVGLGVDTLLHWVVGDRACDRFLRRKYAIRSGTVQTIGSLRGAMLGYGVLVARQIALPLFEANPKAALQACVLESYQSIICSGRNEDARDAIIAALVVYFWDRGIWKFDLFQSAKLDQQSAKVAHAATYGFFPAGEAIYPWPDAMEC